MGGLIGALSWPVLDRVHFGSRFAISPHGVGIAIGFLLGSWWTLREGPKRGVREEHLSSMLFWALVGTIFGARFFYVISHLSEFHSFVDTLKIYNGGISLLGGIAGAILFAYPVIRKHKYRFLQVMDSTAIGFPFGIFVGRIGDLIIGDHLGKPTNAPWAFAYDGGNLSGFTCSGGTCSRLLPNGQTLQIARHSAKLLTPGHLVPAASGVGVHQTALYDYVIAFALFLLMYGVISRRRRREGIPILTFAALYALGRIGTDFLRVEKRFFGLTGSQWASVALVAVAAFTFIRWARQANRPSSGQGLATVERGALGRPRAKTTDFTPPPEPGRSP